ncbi:hypothetical protein [Cystobacter ferrugineus]|uniref:Uncharacterized protein n=1 Tax=Cystobacter ferrugineus TaxID=83449 RepID=A0A1L9AUI3_9BACT|nr:hypothetical protein [Cystobacter ferrugineus]OJH33678.1 hypothetical protein BON30_47425 [Cystobacter ferrugineus]
MSRSTQYRKEAAIRIHRAPWPDARTFEGIEKPVNAASIQLAEGTQQAINKRKRKPSAVRVEKVDLADDTFEIIEFELAPAAEKEKAPDPTKA